MVAGRLDAPRRVLRLFVLVLVLAGLLAMPAGAAPSSVTGDRLAPVVPDALSPQQMRALHRLVDDAAGPPGGPDVRPSVTAGLAATGSSETYHDYCDDAPTGGNDLRRAVITRFPAADTLRLEVTTCGVVTADALRGGVSLVLGTTEGATYLVTIRQVLGSFLGSVVETSGDDPLGVVRHTAGAWLADGGRGVTYEFPAGALDDPDAFLFWLEARDAAATVVDTMPEPDEFAVGSWPGSCDRRDVFQATVGARPQQLTEALASARAAGLIVAAVNEVTATFDVTLADADAARRLLDRPGIATVSAAELFAAPAVTTTASGTGSDAWWRAAVRADAATGRASGVGVAIGVIDNGVDGTRAELTGRVARGRDVVRSQRLDAGANSDRGGHGTLVAGVAAADSSVVAGIAPAATIRPYQVFDFGGCASANAIATAIDAAIADGVDVVNLSLGVPGRTSTVLAEALGRAREAGLVVVAAAGNDAMVDQPSVPAEHPVTIAVGAIGPDGRLAPYSNRAEWLDLVAPGGVGTTADTGILGLGEHDGYAVVNGTSFAAPIVAGAAALHLEMTGASADAVRADLTATATDLGSAGRDRDFGFGLLDVAALLDRAAQVVPTGVRDITSACADAPRGRYADVTSGDVHAAAIDCVAHYAVTSGFADGSFGSGLPVLRGQMATFIANTILSSGGTLPPPSDAFDDVAGSAHAVAIRRLEAAGIVSGVTADTYRPADPVTRAQMAAFLVRALEFRRGVPLTGGETEFVDTAGNVHATNIGKLTAAGISGGTTRSRYQPQPPVTRGQMASFLARGLAYLVDTGAAPAR